MAVAEFSFSNATVFFNKSEGRDKLARTVQYGSRMMVGLTTLAGLEDPTIKLVNEKSGLMLSQLGLARRTHRWFKEIPVIQSIPASLKLKDPLEKAMDFLQKVTLASFLIIDHYGWIKQIGLIKRGKPTDTIWFGLKFFAVSNMVATVYNIYKLQKVDASKIEERAKLRTLIFKHAALSIQISHVSKLRESHDALAGFLGVITSFMDAKEQWPKAKA